MKKVLLIIVALLVLTGCTITRTDTLDYKELTDKILSLNIKTYNKVGKGYKYYAPRGVVRTDENLYNDVLKRGNVNYYLYVDVVSYYYKNVAEYKEDNNAYYYEKIENKNKKGYIKITKRKKKLFVQMVYNYAKIEAYVNEDELNQTMEDISYILSSMKFNDSLLKKMYESGTLDSKEEAYKLFDNKEKEGTFIEYIKEYDKYDGEDNPIVEDSEIKIEDNSNKDQSN